MWIDLIGWAAAAILLLTIGRQVFTEWRNGSTRGLSKWLFAGQLAASAGFVAAMKLAKEINLDRV